VMGKAVPVDDETASLIVQINRIAEHSGVSFRTIDLSQPSTSSAATPAPATPPLPAPPPRLFLRLPPRPPKALRRCCRSAHPSARPAFRPFPIR
jgi:hypothetical protein